MPTPRVLTREQLAKFLPNHDAVRAFEQLFTQVSEALPATDADLEALVAAMPRPNVSMQNNRMIDIESMQIQRRGSAQIVGETQQYQRTNLDSILSRLSILESMQQKRPADQILQRLEAIESFLGVRS